MHTSRVDLGPSCTLPRATESQVFIKYDSKESADSPCLHTFKTSSAAVTLHTWMLRILYSSSLRSITTGLDEHTFVATLQPLNL